MRIIAPFGLIFLTACATYIVPVDAGSNLSSAEAFLDCDGDGYTEADGDCDDSDASVYPGAVDICDKIDNDCDPTLAYGENGEVIPTSFGEPDLCDDHDDDSWTLEEDCDDYDASVYPYAPELCDGEDNDCDGDVDEGCDPEPVDSDGDGYTEADGDCDDNDASVYPGAAEECDELDNDCDGSIDEGVENTYFADEDWDGYGDPSTSLEACEMPYGYVGNDDDCDDSDAEVNPDAFEICGNTVDEDCDGVADDMDGDGNLTSGSHPDCDDTDADVYYGAREVENGIDDDCDGMIDEGFGTGPTDADSDGYSTATDCDDSDASVNPGANEVFNDSVDNNCDGQEDEATSLYLVAEYRSNVDMELSIWTWSDGDDITTGTRWVYSDDIENDNQIVAELSADEYPMDCGFRFSITVNGSSWSCQASAMDGANFDFLVWTAQTDWIDETGLEVWIADASTGSCSLYVQTDSSSICDPVDDT